MRASWGIGATLGQETVEETVPERGVPLPRLRAWRQRRAMTQRELAAVAGVSLASLNRLEHEGRPAAASTVRKLAAALGVEPADLMPPDYGEASPTTS